MFDNHYGKELRHTHIIRDTQRLTFIFSFKINCDIFCSLHACSPIPKSRPFISFSSYAVVDGVEEMPLRNGQCNIFAEF